MTNKCAIFGCIVAWCLCIPGLYAFTWDEINADLARTEKGASLELNQHGFSLLSEVLMNEVAGSVGEIKVPDFSYSIPVLMKIKFSGMTVLPEISNLSVYPDEEGLGVRVTVKNIRVRLGSVRMESHFMSSLATTCYNTVINLGNQIDMPVHARLGMRLDEHQIIKISAEEPDFTLNDNQYSADGPGRCVGIFGIPANITKFIIGTVLKHARGVLVRVIRGQVGSVIPVLEEKINEMSRLSLPVEIPDILVIPSTKLIFALAPASLELTREKMSLELKIRVSGAPDSLKQADKEGSVLPFAVLGLNPEVINQVLEVLFRNGSRELELSPSLHEIFATILKVEELAFFWPDLAQIEVDSPYMKVWVSLQEAPVLAVSESPDTVSGQVSGVSLRFQVKTDGEWRDYFNLHAELGMGVQPVLVNGSLDLTLTAPSLELGGSWAESYQPIDPHFEREEMQNLFSQLLNYVVSTQSPVIFRIPEFSVYGHSIAPDDLRVELPYLKLNLNEILEAQ